MGEAVETDVGDAGVGTIPAETMVVGGPSLVSRHNPRVRREIGDRGVDFREVNHPERGRAVFAEDLARRIGWIKFPRDLAKTLGPEDAFLAHVQSGERSPKMWLLKTSGIEKTVAWAANSARVKPDLKAGLDRIREVYRNEFAGVARPAPAQPPTSDAPEASDVDADADAPAPAPVPKPKLVKPRVVVASPPSAPPASVPDVALSLSASRAISHADVIPNVAPSTTVEVVNSVVDGLLRGIEYGRKLGAQQAAQYAPASPPPPPPSPPTASLPPFVAAEEKRLNTEEKKQFEHRRGELGARCAAILKEGRADKDRWSLIRSNVPCFSSTFSKVDIMDDDEFAEKMRISINVHLRDKMGAHVEYYEYLRRSQEESVSVMEALLAKLKALRADWRATPT